LLALDMGDSVAGGDRCQAVDRAGKRFALASSVRSVSNRSAGSAPNFQGRSDDLKKLRAYVDTLPSATFGEAIERFNQRLLKQVFHDNPRSSSGDRAEAASRR
jgi:hypothetical protein